MDSFAALATLESHMTHIAGLERDQLLLLPELVDDYVGSDNPVRFVDAFVDGLDLAAAGFFADGAVERTSRWRDIDTSTVERPDR